MEQASTLSLYFMLIVKGCSRGNKTYAPVKDGIGSSSDRPLSSDPSVSLDT